MVHMSWAYLTEKQMLRLFWYFDVKHSAWMMSRIWFQASTMVSLCHLLCSFMVCTQIKERVSPSSLSATFITRRTEMPHVPRTKHTHLMALLLADFWHWMPSLSITHATSNTMKPTVTDWIHTNFLCQFIPVLYMMAAYLYPCIGRTLLPSAYLIHPALEVRMSIHTQTQFYRVLWWTFQWIPINLHTTWSNLTMAPPDPFHPQICHCWFQNHQSMLQTPLIFCHLSWNSISKSRLNMMGITIKATSLNLLMGLIISVTNHTSTRNKRTEGFPCPTYLWTGMNSARKGSYSLVMYRHHFFVQLCHWQLLTPSLTLSVLSILFVTAPGHSLQRWQIVIQVERFGFRATLKKNTVLNHSEPTRIYPMPNIMHCMERVHQRPYPRYVSSQSNQMRCSILSELSLELLFLGTMQIVYGPSWRNTPLFFIWTPCGLSSVWLLNATISSSKVIVKMHSVKVFYLQMRSLSSSHQFETQKLPKMNIGS